MKLTRVEHRGGACVSRRFVSKRGARWILVTCGVLLSPMGLRAGWAGEDAESHPEDVFQQQLDELEDSIDAHKRDRDSSGLEDDLKRAGALHKEAAEDDEIREDVVKLIGTVTRGSRDVPLATAMLKTLAELGDERGARYIKPYLRQPDKKSVPEMLDVAVAAAAEVHDEMLVGPLLEIVLKSKCFGIASKAVGALGHYGEVKRARTKILETLLKTTKKCRPGGPGRNSGATVAPMDGTGGGDGGSGRDGGAGARWAALSNSVPRALQNLTGQELRGIDAWIDMLKDYKGKYDNLFPDSD